MSVRTMVDVGWAVRITPSDTSTAWLNLGGGYVGSRMGRATWRDYDDALDASHKWDGCDPVIVRVRFFVRKGAT
jgi:hypothetical protein